jgi:hypothetical protein
VKGNDLSNELVPRFVLVFEHLVGVLPTATRSAQFNAYRTIRSWKRAVSMFQVNEMLARHMWHVSWHMHHQLEVVTYLHPDAVEYVTEWIDIAGLPVHRVWYAEPFKLARQIATMPDLAAIFDPDPAHQLTFGRKGRILDPANPDLIRGF